MKCDAEPGTGKLPLLSLLLIVCGWSLGVPLRPAAAQQPTALEVSANPARSAPVTLRWPLGSGTTRVSIFTQLGTRVLERELGSDPGRFSWDLRTDAGQDVANGAYLLVVTRSDGSRFRRRLLVAR